MVHGPAQPAPSTRRPLSAAARTLLLFFVVGALAGCCGGFGRLFTITSWLTWPHVSATYLGSGGTSSSRSGGAVSCERRYQILDLGGTRVLTHDAPCFVLLGPSPDVGEWVTVAIQPNGGSTAVSATEAFGLGPLDVFGILLLLVPPAGLALLHRRGTLRADVPPG